MCGTVSLQLIMCLLREDIANSFPRHKMQVRKRKEDTSPKAGNEGCLQ